MISITDRPVCAECDFYQYRKGTHDDGRSRHQCNRERMAPVAVSRDLVTGGEIIQSTGLIHDCETQRRNGMFFWLPLQSERCGPNGKFFRANHPSKETGRLIRALDAAETR